MRILSMINTKLSDDRFLAKLLDMTGNTEQLEVFEHRDHPGWLYLLLIA